MRYAGLIVVCAALALAACSKKESEQAPVTAAPGAAPAAASPFDAAVMARGEHLYEQNCAQCHGPEAQGHPDWQTPSDGTFTAAPPLNGTGYTWKRSRAQLIAIIRDGASRGGVPVMPAWKGRLSDRDINDILTWLQALWPADVYARWLQANPPPAKPAG